MATEGMQPQSAGEVNNAVGSLLRQFIALRSEVQRFSNALAALDLTGAPYNMSAQQQADIKTAVNGLNTAAQAVDLTFINRLAGLF